MPLSLLRLDRRLGLLDFAPLFFDVCPQGNFISVALDPVVFFVRQNSSQLRPSSHLVLNALHQLLVVRVEDQEVLVRHRVSLT